jgi:hypothetical protein
LPVATLTQPQACNNHEGEGHDARSGLIAIGETLRHPDLVGENDDAPGTSMSHAGRVELASTNGAPPKPGTSSQESSTREVRSLKDCFTGEAVLQTAIDDARRIRGAALRSAPGYGESGPLARGIPPSVGSSRFTRSQDV